jgi:hypothetical protein
MPQISHLIWAPKLIVYEWACDEFGSPKFCSLGCRWSYCSWEIRVIFYILKLSTAMVQTHFCCCVCKFFSMCICNVGSNLCNLILFNLPSHPFEIVGLLDHPELSYRNLQAGPKGSPPLDCVSTVTPVIEKTWIRKLQFMVMKAMKPPFGHICASLKTWSTP